MKISNNQSATLIERSKKVLAGGVSSEFRKYNHPHVIFYTHGKGSRIYDVDGNEYVDFTLSQGPLILGHSHPEVLWAVMSIPNRDSFLLDNILKKSNLPRNLTL